CWRRSMSLQATDGGYRAPLSDARADVMAEMRRRAGRGGKYTRYASDPIGFAREVLGLHVWSRQRVVLESANDHQRTAIRAGRKVSKSTSIAALALWNALARGQPSFLTSS